MTGVGCYVTLPVALSVNLAEFYLLATLMVGAIAVVNMLKDVRAHDAVK